MPDLLLFTPNSTVPHPPQSHRLLPFRFPSEYEESLVHYSPELNSLPQVVSTRKERRKTGRAITVNAELDSDDAGAIEAHGSRVKRPRNAMSDRKEHKKGGGGRRRKQVVVNGELMEERLEKPSHTYIRLIAEAITVRVLAIMAYRRHQ